MKRAFTLLELLISITLIAVVAAGITGILSICLGYNDKLRANRSTELNRKIFEDRMTDLIHRIYIDPNSNTSATTFFVGQTGMGVPPGQTVQPGQTISATGTNTSGTQTGQTSAPSGVGGSSGNADTLMFTTIGRKPRAAFLASTDDFETNNQHFGPQGGVTEYSVSLTPVGDPKGKTGLIVREQIPADQDATQGGYESILEPDISRITYEFFDGTTWQTSWNTFNQTTRQLPNAIRVTYSLTGDKTDHVFVVGVLLSNVTPNNPATQTGGS
jgi:prepilin-type N-terminal cleavage/methylation domain-containing protein